MTSANDTITFTVNKEHSVANNSGGANTGNAGDKHAPVGLYGGWTWRDLIRASQTWGSYPGGARFVKAELWLKNSTAVHLGRGTSPRVRLARLNADFTASGGGENSWGTTYGTVYGGPGVTGPTTDSGAIATGDGTIVKIDVSDTYEPILPAGVQQRDGTPGAGAANNGFRLYSFDESATSRATEFESIRGAYDPRFVLTLKVGVLPGPPALVSPSGVVGAAPTAFVCTATETPVYDHDLEVSTDPTFASGMLTSQHGVSGGISGATCTSAYAGSAQPVGVPIYWRMRTSNDLGVDGGWSATGSYSISTSGAGAITYPVADGLARIGNLTEEVEWTDTGLHAKPQITWRFNDTAGRIADRVDVKFYTDVGVLEDTHTFTGSFAANTDLDLDTTWAVQRGIFHKVEVIPYVAGVAQTSSGLRRFKCQWGQGQYTCAPGATATGHRFVPGAVTGTDARVAFLHRFRGGTTGAWKATIGAAGAPQTNWDVLVRLGTRNGMPVFPQMQMFWTVAAATPPDQWVFASCTGALDDGFRRYGVKSLRVITTASTQGTISAKPDPGAVGVIVSGKTQYTWSAYVHTGGRTLNAPVYLRALDEAGVQFWSGAAVPSATVSNSSSARDGWQRIWGTFFTPDGAQRITPVIMVGGGASEELRIDAVQLEEGPYASIWTPGLLGPQVILDKGGISIDAVKGGFFRLAASLHVPGDRNVIELYQKGLRFGSDTELSSPAVGTLAVNGVVLGAGTGTAFPVGPATYQRFFRTDLGLEFYYDGTRWLSSQLFEREFRSNESAPQVYAATQAGAFRTGLLGAAFWAVELRMSYFVAGGGTALSVSHKWDVAHVLDPSSASLAAPSINSGASATWLQIVTALNAVVAATEFEVVTNVTKTGTPGGLRIFPVLYYRRIAT